MSDLHKLDLSVRVRNALRQSGIRYVYQLRTMSDAELLALRNFGTRSLAEVRKALRAQYN
jgi:DNA-directed RNA polymerase alpha subunit